MPVKFTRIVFKNNVSPNLPVELMPWKEKLCSSLSFRLRWHDVLIRGKSSAWPI